MASSWLLSVQRGDPGVSRTLARAGLSVLSWGWQAAQWLKTGAYLTGLRRSRPLALPVLSVGNLAVGGTGKTPFVAWLVTQLRALGRTPGVLARGYGAPVDATGALNDEGAVLQHLLGADLPQVQDGDRLRGGETLRATWPAVDAVVLDDGFQHRRIGRALDIVLLDATRPFGYGHFLPRGLLREGPRALARADAVVLTRTERVDAAALEAAKAQIRAVFDGPVALARSEPRPEALLHELAGARVFVLCGIGNPDAFVGTLEDLGAIVAGSRFLRDHERLLPEAWPDLRAEARSVGAECIVMTRKDAVKCESLVAEVTIVDMELVVHEGEAALLDAVRAALGSG
jgi:tetraacyldisaccharide 4'-kinase